jgi:5'-methylthioadenosine phosphorylase
MPEAEIGVFGGSGFYELLGGAEEVDIETRFGPPSDRIALGEVGGRRVAFLPRHGRRHTIPPQRVNYRANVAAMAALGVRRILGPCAAGSLQRTVRPGDFVLCEQYVDRTTGRADTFYDGPEVTHVSMAQPYCPEMTALITGQARAMELPLHERGTVVVIQGPRFSTRAESRWFQAQGWEVINMTQYPEAPLARELEICYANISLITDYDVGVAGDPGVVPVTAAEVVRIFRANLDRLRELILRVIPMIPGERTCICSTALAHARV